MGQTVTDQLDAATVASRLDLGEDFSEWLTALEDIGPPKTPMPLPAGTELRALLTRIKVPDVDIDEIVAARPTPESTPELWWLLERTHHALVGTGQPSTGTLNALERRPIPRMPTLPYALGPAARLFYVYAVVSTVPSVLAANAAREIPEETTWETFTDLGEKVEIHRRTFGVGGMDKQFWFALHSRGNIHSLGRLQFNLMTIGHDVSDLNVPFAKGDPALGVHIPEWGGPMSPEACDASFARVPGFFAKHYPDHPARIATCGSWLLDPQLADYLPESSNIVHFQRRFELLPESAGTHDADESIIEFVFRRVDVDLDELPQDTTLQRAIVSHLKSGKHWYARTGWVEI